MRILVLGASSQIGAALAQAFAPSNALILVGRNTANLKIAAKKCDIAGAAAVTCVQQDLCAGVDSVLRVIDGKRIDLLVDAASVSSRHRDDEIGADEIARYVSADVISHIVLVDHILQNQLTPPNIIFISSILVFMKNPGRAIYSALKTLNESYLVKLADSRVGLSLTIVYVGTLIDTAKETKKLSQLVSAVVDALKREKRKVIFGFSGIFLVALFRLQPIVFDWFVIGQRMIRRLLSRN